MADMPETAEAQLSGRPAQKQFGSRRAADAPNFSRATFARVAKLLDPSSGKGKGQFMQLAQMAGVSRKAIRNWMLPESDPQHRAMPTTAKRTIAILAHLAMTGYLNEKRMNEIVALENAMAADQDVFQKVARRMSVALRKAEASKGKPRQAPGADVADTVPPTTPGGVNPAPAAE